jgi:hypothetical protein
VSTLACAGLLALWVVFQAVLYGRTAHLWLNVINVAVPFAALFAVTLTIYMAVFGLIERWTASPVSRNAALVLGAVLAPLSYLATAAWFHESDDPQTLGAWIRFSAAQSSFDPFFFRFRSRRAGSARSASRCPGLREFRQELLVALAGPPYARVATNVTDGESGLQASASSTANPDPVSRSISSR